MILYVPSSLSSSVNSCEPYKVYYSPNTFFSSKALIVGKITQLKINLKIKMAKFESLNHSTVCSTTCYFNRRTNKYLQTMF